MARDVSTQLHQWNVKRDIYIEIYDRGLHWFCKFFFGGGERSWKELCFEEKMKRYSLGKGFETIWLWNCRDKFSDCCTLIGELFNRSKLDRSNIYHTYVKDTVLFRTSRDQLLSLQALLKVSPMHLPFMQFLKVESLETSLNLTWLSVARRSSWTYTL